MIEKQRLILWRQVWGLSALLAAILLSFSIYGVYQSKILTNLGFLKLAVWLGIFQGLLGTVIEPLFGSLSDRILRRFGSRLPQVTAGVTAGGSVFVLLALMLETNLPVAISWLIPLLMTLWITAMIAVRGPIVALLQQFTPTRELPIAQSILVLVLGLIGAINPLVEAGIQQMGVSVTFLLGGILLLVGATLFYQTTPNPSVTGMFQSSQQHEIDRESKWLWGLILGIGLGVGLELTFLQAIFPTILSPQLPWLNQALITSSILLIAALTSLRLGKLTVKWGEIKAMQVGLGAIAVLVSLSYFNPSSIVAIGLLLGVGIALGLVFISMVPLVLLLVPATEAGLGTGLFFGGYGAANAINSLLTQLIGNLSLMQGLLGIFGAFLMTFFLLQKCYISRDFR